MPSGVPTNMHCWAWASTKGNADKWHKNLGWRDYPSKKHGCLLLVTGVGPATSSRPPVWRPADSAWAPTQTASSLFLSTWSAAGQVHPPALTVALLNPAQSPGPDFQPVVGWKTRKETVSLCNKEENTWCNEPSEDKLGVKGKEIIPLLFLFLKKKW